jgi:hypothetical protein
VIVASGAGVHTLWGGKECEITENSVEEESRTLQGEGKEESRKENDDCFALPFAYVRGQNIHFVQTNFQSNSQSNFQSNVDTSQSKIPAVTVSSSYVPRPLLSGEYLVPFFRSRKSSLTSNDDDDQENIKPLTTTHLLLVGGGTHEHFASWNDLTG